MTAEVERPKASPPNWANIVSALVAFGTAVAVCAGFAVRADMRITSLEKQIDALVLSQSSPAGSTAPPTKRSSCDDLARRVATAYENGTNLTVGIPLENLMSRMGCATPRP